jgi:hypothetical protein
VGFEVLWAEDLSWINELVMVHTAITKLVVVHTAINNTPVDVILKIS